MTRDFVRLIVDKRASFGSELNSPNFDLSLHHSDPERRSLLILIWESGYPHSEIMMK